MNEIKRVRKKSIWNIIKKFGVAIIATSAIIIICLIIYISILVYFGMRGDHFAEIGEYDLAIQSYETGSNLCLCDEMKKDYKIAITENKMAKNLSLIKTTPPPREIYDLVATKGNIQPDSITKLHEILALLWTDKEAQKLLCLLVQNNIHIIIVPNFDDSSGFLAGETLNYNFYKMEIEIPEKTLRNYKKGVKDSIFAFVAICHEMCHCITCVNFHNKKDSLEEELTASMVGRNIVNRILYGRDINMEETRDYSEKYFREITCRTDFYKDIQVYGNYYESLRDFGINPPHPEVYQDLLQLYKKVKRSSRNKYKFDKLEKMMETQN